MNPVDILRHASADAGIDPDVAVSMANKKLNEDMKHVQQNDTLMFYKLLDSHSAFVHFVTADSNLNLMHSLAYFDHMLKHNGIEDIYMNSKSKKIINGLKLVGVNLEQSDRPEYPIMGRLV